MLDKYGKGWSVATLKNAKKFYCVYSEKLNTVYPIDGEKAKHRLANSEEIKKSLSPLSESGITIHTFTLSWSHYLVLMRIKNQNERNFYEPKIRNYHPIHD